MFGLENFAWSVLYKLCITKACSFGKFNTTKRHEHVRKIKRKEQLLVFPN